MRACALLWTLLGLTACSELPTEVMAASTIDPQALVGSWQVRSRSPWTNGEQRWTLLADGEAIHAQRFAEWVEPDEACSWSLDGDVLVLDCPNRLQRARVVVDGDRVEFAPLAREEGAHEEPHLVLPDEGDEIARFAARILARGVDVDGEGRDFVNVETQVVIVHADFRIETFHQRGGHSWMTQHGDWRCALEANDELECRGDSDALARRAPWLSAEQLAETTATTMRVPFDVKTGEPRFEGQLSMRNFWTR